MKKIIKVKCPTCESEFNYYDSESRPFCTEKCKLIDLGQWLTESYSVPGKTLEEERLERELEDIDYHRNFTH